MISIIIPLYNKQEQIVSCIKSVLSQSFRSFEIVIINDGSTDKSLEKISQLSDPRIRIFKQRNSGVSAARNRGISEAKYDFIALLDADDLWHKNYLQTQWELHLKYPACNVCACNYEYKNSSGKITQTKINGLKFNCKDGVIDNYFDVASRSNPPICSSSIMIKKSALQLIGGFPVGITSGEDLLTWARLAVNNKIAYSKSTQAIYVTENSFTPKRKITNFDPVGDSLYKLYSEHPSKYLLKYNSLWHKNRCNIALRNNQGILAFSEAFKALKYDHFNYKIYIYILLIFSPKKIIQKFLH
ncbi:MAG: glycosyltransferase [Rikenellaceae bacterium]